MRGDHQCRALLFGGAQQQPHGIGSRLVVPLGQPAPQFGDPLVLGAADSVGESRSFRAFLSVGATDEASAIGPLLQAFPSFAGREAATRTLEGTVTEIERPFSRFSHPLQIILKGAAPKPVLTLVALRDKGCEYRNVAGAFADGDGHTLDLTDKKGKRTTVTGRRDAGSPQLRASSRSASSCAATNGRCFRSSSAWSETGRRPKTSRRMS